MQFDERAFLENQAWVDSMLSWDSNYCDRLQANHSPEVFWVGCSGSRVPAEQLCNASPGDLFVHRNVGHRGPNVSERAGIRHFSSGGTLYHCLWP